MLSVTKELPKEMLPIFQRIDGELVLKPLLQVIFEQLYDVGIRDFCFVIGRGKRSIEDHFTPDWDFLEYLLKAGKELAAKSLERLAQKKNYNAEYFYSRAFSSMLWFAGCR